MPLFQILENPQTRVEYFLMLHLSSKFWVPRSIHSKVLHICRKTVFKAPSGLWFKFSNFRLSTMSQTGQRFLYICIDKAQLTPNNVGNPKRLKKDSLQFDKSLVKFSYYGFLSIRNQKFPAHILRFVSPTSSKRIAAASNF